MVGTLDGWLKVGITIAESSTIVLAGISTLTVKGHSSCMTDVSLGWFLHH